MIRVKILKYPVFMARATISVEWGDEEPWMHGVIVRPNNFHRGCYYTILVMKTGRLIMQNSKHIHGTTITSEEYLCKRIKRHQGNWRMFLCKQHEGKCLSPQTVIHKHHHRNIIESESSFQNWGRKSQGNACGLWYCRNIWPKYNTAQASSAKAMCSEIT